MQQAMQCFSILANSLPPRKTRGSYSSSSVHALRQGEFTQQASCWVPCLHGSKDQTPHIAIPMRTLVLHSKAAGVWKEAGSNPQSSGCTSFLFIQLDKGKARISHNSRPRRCLSRPLSPRDLAQHPPGHPLAWQECLTFTKNKPYHFITATR